MAFHGFWAMWASALTSLRQYCEGLGLQVKEVGPFRMVS